MNLTGPHESFNSSTMFLKCSNGVGYIIRSSLSSFVKSRIAVCILNVIFGIVGTYLNILVLFVFLKSKNMRKKSGYFSIMILSTTDLTVVTSLPAVFLVETIAEIMETSFDTRCLYNTCSVIVTITAPLLSATSLIVMNIERYLAIVHPFFHRTNVTKRKMIWTFNIFGCILLAYGAIYLIWPNIGRLVYSVGAFILCSTTLFQYSSIFFIARKRLTCPVNNVNNEEISSNLRIFLRELKMAKTYLLIVFLCILLYLPIAINNGTWQLFFENEQTRSALLHRSLWLILLITMNAALNCLIFFWGNRELRK